jgi:hypothetical protein
MKPLPTKTGLPHLDLPSWEKGYSDGFRGNVWWPGPGIEPLSYSAGYQEARAERDPGAEPRPWSNGRTTGSYVMASDERRLLELLVESEGGATDALLAGCGFSLDLIVGLVQAGLATATRERTFAASKPVEVSRVRITVAGRRALAERAP